MKIDDERKSHFHMKVATECIIEVLIDSWFQKEREREWENPKKKRKRKRKQLKKTKRFQFDSAAPIQLFSCRTNLPSDVGPGMAVYPSLRDRTSTASSQSLYYPQPSSNVSKYCILSFICVFQKQHFPPPPIFDNYVRVPPASDGWISQKFHRNNQMSTVNLAKDIAPIILACISFWLWHLLQSQQHLLSLLCMLLHVAFTHASSNDIQSKIFQVT